MTTRTSAPYGRNAAHSTSQPRGRKLADVFTALALLLIAVIAFAMGLEPLFKGPLAITAVVLLFLSAIADSMRRRFRRR